LTKRRGTVFSATLTDRRREFSFQLFGGKNVISSCFTFSVLLGGAGVKHDTQIACHVKMNIMSAISTYFVPKGLVTKTLKIMASAREVSLYR
jgi:hypothetical protein